MKRNQTHQPIVNLDKLWTLVTAQTKTNAEKNKDKVAVIDVTKSVSQIVFLIYAVFAGIFQGSWKRRATKNSSCRQGKAIQQVGREENQGSRWSLRTQSLSGETSS